MILSERQLVAVLAAANSAAADAFIKAVDRVSSGADPDEMIQEGLALLASAVHSGRLQSAVETFGVSTQMLSDDLEDGFLRLKQAVEGLLHVMPTTGQA
jgi:hypothetical protein